MRRLLNIAFNNDSNVLLNLREALLDVFANLSDQIKVAHPDLPNPERVTDHNVLLEINPTDATIVQSYKTLYNLLLRTEQLKTAYLEGDRSIRNKTHIGYLLYQLSQDFQALGFHFPKTALVPSNFQDFANILQSTLSADISVAEDDDSMSAELRGHIKLMIRAKLRGRPYQALRNKNGFYELHTQDGFEEHENDAAIHSAKILLTTYNLLARLNTVISGLTHLNELAVVPYIVHFLVSYYPKQLSQLFTELSQAQDIAPELFGYLLKDILIKIDALEDSLGLAPGTLSTPLIEKVQHLTNENAEQPNGFWAMERTLYRVDPIQAQIDATETKLAQDTELLRTLQTHKGLALNQLTIEQLHDLVEQLQQTDAIKPAVRDALIEDCEEALYDIDNPFAQQRYLPFFTVPFEAIGNFISTVGSYAMSSNYALALQALKKAIPAKTTDIRILRTQQNMLHAKAIAWSQALATAQEITTAENHVDSELARTLEIFHDTQEDIELSETNNDEALYYDAPEEAPAQQSTFKQAQALLQLMHNSLAPEVVALYGLTQPSQRQYQTVNPNAPMFIQTLMHLNNLVVQGEKWNDDYHSSAWMSLLYNTPSAVKAALQVYSNALVIPEVPNVALPAGTQEVTMVTDYLRNQHVAMQAAAEAAEDDIQVVTPRDAYQATAEGIAAQSLPKIGAKLHHLVTMMVEEVPYQLVQDENRFYHYQMRDDAAPQAQIAPVHQALLPLLNLCIRTDSTLESLDGVLQAQKGACRFLHFLHFHMTQLKPLTAEITASMGKFKDSYAEIAKDWMTVLAQLEEHYFLKPGTLVDKLAAHMGVGTMSSQFKRHQIRLDYLTLLESQLIEKKADLLDQKNTLTTTTPTIQYIPGFLGSAMDWLCGESNITCLEKLDTELQEVEARLAVIESRKPDLLIKDLKAKMMAQLKETVPVFEHEVNQGSGKEVAKPANRFFSRSMIPLQAIKAAFLFVMSVLASYFWARNTAAGKRFTGLTGITQADVLKRLGVVEQADIDRITSTSDLNALVGRDALAACVYEGSISEASDTIVSEQIDTVARTCAQEAAIEATPADNGELTPPPAIMGM